MVSIGAREKWGFSTDCVHSFDDLLHYGRSLDPVTLQEQQKKVQFDDPAMVIRTSGSTGEPKACQFTNQAFVLSVQIVASAFLVKNGEHSRLFNDLPFSWSSGTCVGVAIPALGVTSVNIPSVFTVRDRSTVCLKRSFLAFFLVAAEIYFRTSSTTLQLVNHCLRIMTSALSGYQRPVASVFLKNLLGRSCSCSPTSNWAWLTERRKPFVWSCIRSLREMALIPRPTAG